MMIQLRTPSNQTVFLISDVPQMPSVTVDATVVPATPSFAQAQFRWTAQLRFAGSETLYGRPGTPLDVTKTTTGGHLVINPADWGRIRGGNLTVSVIATIDGQTVTAQLPGLRIAGKNPTPAAVRAALGNNTLCRIADQESKCRQFGNDSWPLFSKDNLGGAGIMQITPAAEDQRWNWRINVQAGIMKYNRSYDLTNTYVESVRKSPQFATLVAAVNQARAKEKLPALTITVPPWTTDQRMRDAVRGYNGWAGHDLVVPNLHLHEYTLSLDSDDCLRVNLIPNTNRAEAIWEPVEPSERPQAVGDPNYVAHVFA